jgi:eukaryotic-like serine/threonine-protein kinase
MALSPGTRLGSYEITTQIGAGGMGEVYKAIDSRLGRAVAVKVLPQKLATDPDAMKRFRREARAVAALSHPNIVAIHDFGEQDSVLYVVLEYLEGETLRELLRKGTGGWRAGVEWVAAVAETIAEVHAKGIVHQDLKPDNVFITSQGTLKVLDFGVASSFGPSDEGRTQTALTDAGVAVGTIGYMSPERVRGQASTAASDIFSLGCILYEALMGIRAFQKETAADTISAILNEEPQFPEAGRTWPIELARITERCLAKRPSERFQSGRDLAFALRSALNPEVRDQAPESVAVLPFTNAGGADAEYLSDGIAESLINNLARISRLRVIPRSTVFRYKGTELDPQALGRELQARLLLMGKVLQRGDHLLVQAELVDAAERKQVWGERFNRKSADIFEVEDEISRQIAERLQLKFSGDEKKVADRSTSDAVAYDLYLKARHHWGKRTPESIRRAIQYLEAAIARDPNFAAAWASLADTRILFGWYGAGVIRELFDGAIASARTAIRLDPALGEAHAALGFGLCCTGDWADGLGECERAIRLSPKYFLAYDWFAISLSSLGRFEEALAAIGSAKRLEPLSLVVHHHEAWVNIMAGRFGEAARIAGQALELDGNYSFAWWWLGIAQTELGQTEEAVRSLERARAIFGDFQLGHSALGHGYARAGRRDEALACLEALTRSDPQCVDPYHMALVHAGLSQVDEAIACLSQASAANSAWLRIYGPHDPRLNDLRGEPRLENLLRTSASGSGITEKQT